MSATAAALPQPKAPPQDSASTRILDAISALLTRQRESILSGSADELPAISQALGLQLRHASERLPRSAVAGSASALTQLRNEARINLELLHRREVAVQESLDAMLVNSNRLDSQHQARVYASAGTLARTRQVGRAFASA